MKQYFYLYVHTHIYMYVCVYKILQKSEIKKKNTNNEGKRLVTDKHLFSFMQIPAFSSTTE